jgi:hypothetical protein
MGPALTAVQQAQLKFSDPAVRVQIRGWHEAGMSLLDMVDRIGLSGEFTGPLREAIAGLGADEVAIIRKAMIAEIDRAGASEVAPMPVDCTLDRVSGPVAVTAAEVDGRPFAKVTNGKAKA